MIIASNPFTLAVFMQLIKSFLHALVTVPTTSAACITVLAAGGLGFLGGSGTGGLGFLGGSGTGTFLGLGALGLGDTAFGLGLGDTAFGLGLGETAFGLGACGDTAFGLEAALRASFAIRIFSFRTVEVPTTASACIQQYATLPTLHDARLLH
jgi:hypothetical protein